MPKDDVNLDSPVAKLLEEHTDVLLERSGETLALQDVPRSTWRHRKPQHA